MNVTAKRIALIGSGYIGQALLHFWKGQAYHLIATTTTEEKIEALRQIADETIVMTTSNKERLASLIDGADACVITLAPKDGAGYIETYLKSAEDIAHLLEGRKRPFHLIYTSSISVYGKTESSQVTEASPLNPETENQRILAKTEAIYLGIKNPHVGVTVLRLGGIFGPGRELSSRAARLLGRPMAGSGDEKTNHTHLDDILGAIDFCLRKEVYGLYNLTMDSHPTRRELYGKLALDLGLPQPTWDSAPKSSHGIGIAVDSAKLKAKGYSFAHVKLFASE